MSGKRSDDGGERPSESAPGRAWPPSRGATPPPAGDFAYESTLKPASADAIGLDRSALPPSPSKRAPPQDIGLEHTLAPGPLPGAQTREDLDVTLPGGDRTLSSDEHLRAQVLGSLRSVSGPSQPSDPAGGEDDTIRGRTFGRYLLLERLGEGGMGMVYAAYDPELDRKIALKLVRAGTSEHGGARSRLLREAQAMARLSHLNVVTVHDVGAVDDQVFVAMEYIRGQTIDAWVEASAPTWQEIVAAFRQAGAGLAAAHTAHLIHRDFKPQNVMISAEGRVVVMDFGLARARSGKRPDEEEQLGRLTSSALDLEITGGEAILGTPAYMAPEQMEGAEADARSDLFSFCVTLWRCLYRQPPFAGESFLDLADNVTNGVLDPPKDTRGVPNWLRKVLERGLAVDPYNRWPTMDALLEALDNDPTRRRRLLITVAAAAIVGVAALAATFIYQRSARSECRVVAAEVDAIWNDGARQELRDGFRKSGLPYANDELGKIVPLLDRFAGGWRSARRQVCVDGLDDRITARRHDQAVACLDEARGALAARMSRLSDGDPAALVAAVDLITDLPAPAECRDPERLARRPLPPPADAEEVASIRARLARAAALEIEGDLAGAQAIAEEALAAAEQLGWPPLTITARVRLGVLLTRKDELARAEEELHRAYVDARREGLGEAAADAAIVLATAIGRLEGRPREGRIWAEVARAELAALGEPQGERAAELELALGDIARLGHDLAAAEARYRAALAIWEPALGADHLKVGVAVDRIGALLLEAGRHADALPILEQAVAIQEANGGPSHPRVAGALDALGTALLALGRLDAAETTCRRALALRERALGSTHADVARSLFNLGLILTTVGDRDAEVIINYRRALAILIAEHGEKSPDVARAYVLIGEAEVRARDLDEAARSARAALEILEGLYGPSFPLVAHPLVLLASIERERGDLEAAHAAAARALEIREQSQAPPAEVATARLILAMILADEGAEDEAMEAIDRARGEAVGAGPAGAAVVHEIDTWLNGQVER
ncbi:MAG: tetratricopeptide repeat protein [Myxococcales bacterium]|nr:tetratricopeptide repeat protein [Myxococcales bacterium]